MKPDAYSFTPHAPIKIKAIPWPFCQRCGLLYLHNEPTAQAIRWGCNWKAHPQADQAPQQEPSQ